MFCPYEVVLITSDIINLYKFMFIVLLYTFRGYYKCICDVMFVCMYLYLIRIAAAFLLLVILGK